MQAMLILSIETSCDETSVAVVQNGCEVLSNIIASQIAQHTETGGVVPEVAAREHIRVMTHVLKQAMTEAKVTWNEIDSIAVTKEPGLYGSLIVGRSTAAALAFAKDKPLIEVNHIHGHMYSTWLLGGAEDAPVSLPEYPILTLTVSGGHNELVLVEGPGQFTILAESIDDAAGEAFDKVARLLGLGYPGGPVIEKRALLGKPTFRFPIGLPKENNFSFSGLKTALLYHVQENADRLKEETFVNDTAHSFQKAAVEALVLKLMRALQDHPVKEVHLTGGVSANKALRARIEEELGRLSSPPIFRFPKRMSYCTDNAAMIAAAAYFMQAKA
ncbi:MAG: tRNA (adenosine(37)-N6)-threonylcarbamoyltransferase complex transferase subunit TsaD [Patescibacteria group bacterium]